MSYQENFKKIIDNAKELNIADVYEQETGWTLHKNLGPCPFCSSGQSGEQGSDGAFSIQRKSNYGHCFSCGTSTDVIGLVQHLQKIDFKTTIHYFAHNYFNTNLENPESLVIPKQNRIAKNWTKPTAEEETQYDIDKKNKLAYLIKLAKDNANKDIAKGYLKARAIKELPNNFYYQHNSYNNLPEGVIFLDDDECLLNKRFVSNQLPEGVKKAFSYGKLTNAVYSKTFNADKKTVYITEGVINALSFYSINTSAIALFASTNHISEVERFKPFFNYKKVIIAFDFDRAGQQSAVKLADFILTNFKAESLSILLFPKNKDANDLLQQNTLQLHLKIAHNYINVTKDYIKLELKAIDNDFANYIPNNYYTNYSYNLKKEEEQNNTFKLGVASEFDIDFNTETLQQRGITKISEYWKIKDNLKNSYIFDSLCLNNDEATIVWRPTEYQNFQQLDILKAPENNIIGINKLKTKIEAMKADINAQLIDESTSKKERDRLAKMKPLDHIFICLNFDDYIRLCEADENPLLLLDEQLDSLIYFEELKQNTWNIILLPNNSKRQKELVQKIALFYIDIKIYYPENAFSINEYLQKYGIGSFLSRLNNALPFKFWDYEDGNITLNLIALLNFLEINGYYTYEDQRDKRGYQYINIIGRTVKSYEDKELFVREVRAFANHWLEKRGEMIKIRNKIMIATEFSERNISQLKQISLNFNNSSPDYQNFFFTDGFMWTVTNKKIEKHSQKIKDFYIWEKDILNYPSEIKTSPFKITYRKNYVEMLNKLDTMDKDSEEWLKLKSQIKNTPDNFRYDIVIKDKNNYFLQFLWLTSYVYWKKCEEKGYEIKTNDFWYELEKLDILSVEEIDEMKLHLINKITWLGYFMNDYRGPESDYGLAILDAIDLKNDGLKREAAGGGKSLITDAIKQIKRTMKIKAEAEDFTKNIHRYENYDKEKIIVLDDMHKNSKLGDILTDFSGGIQINPKHKKPIEIPLINAPKIIITRNYIDDEGARVDRRIGRIFVCDFFHDHKGGKYKEKRSPKTFFGRSLFLDDNDQEKSDLINFFAYSYMVNKIYGEVNSPTEELEHYRIIKKIGEPLIEFLENLLETEQGYFDLAFLFAEFKLQYKEVMTSWQRTHDYNTSSNFKKLIDFYCKVNNLVYNPKELLNNPTIEPNRIIKKSTKRFNSIGDAVTAEHIFIMQYDKYQKPIEEEKNEEYKNNDIPF